MAHTIEVHLAANVEKYNQGMAAAKKTGADTVGFIASIFNTVKSYFAGMWDSIKSFFSNLSDKGSSAWSSFSNSASGAFDKIKSMLPGATAAIKSSGDAMEETEKKSDSLITKIGVGIVAAFVAAAAAVVTFTAKGLLVDSAFAKLSISGDIGAGALSKFESVAARSGTSAQDMAGAMGKLHDEMKKAAAADDTGIFEKLGVSITDSNNALLKTDDVTVDVAKKIAAMSSEAEKYDAAAKVGFSGKVQLLEDIAHAHELTSGTTDEQAAAVVRLGKVWHEILPGGKSMWAEISTFLSAAFTPAITDASIAVLEGKNKIVQAFEQIFAGGTGFAKFGEQIKNWAKEASGWFSSVAKSSTDATIGIMKFIAEKTGMGDPNAFKPTAGYVPGLVPLASGKNAPIVTEAEKKAKEEYEATTKAIKAQIDAQQMEAQTGAALTSGQRIALTMAAGLRDGTLKLTDAQKIERTEMLNTLIAQEKANAASRAAGAAADAAAKKEAEAYANISSAIAAKIVENKAELATGLLTTESQRLGARIDAQQAAGKNVLTAAHLAAAKAQLVVLAASEREVAASKAQKEVNKYIDESVTARYAARDALEAEYEAYGKSAAVRDVLMVAVNAQTWKQKELDKLRADGLPISGEIINQLDAEAAARTKMGQATLGQSQALKLANDLLAQNKQYAADSISDPRARAMAQLKLETDIQQDIIRLAGEGTEAKKKAQTEYDTWYANRMTSIAAGVKVEQANQLLDIMNALDDSAQSAAQGMANSFGQVGQAIGSLTSALTGYGRTQAGIALQLAQATQAAGGDQGKIQRANALAAQQSAQAQIRSYGDMAGAAKGFFKEGSRGYVALETAEKTFRAFEMAMAIKNMVAKSGLLEAFTGLFVASKATETAATVASVAPDVAASMAKGTAAAAVGVASQAQGDPYSAWARMAAMAAVMAALGFAVAGGGGGGGGRTAAEQQAINGTSMYYDKDGKLNKSDLTSGVFGNSTAKSDSIARAIALSAANSDIELNYTAGMLASLQAIEASMAGLTNLIVRTTGLTDGKSFGIQEGQINKGKPTDLISTVMTGVTQALFGPGIGGAIAGFVNNLWGKTTQTIVDSGIQIGGNVRSLQNGTGFQQYASVDTTKSSWFGLSKNTSNSVQTAGLSSELTSQFGLIFTNLESALKVAATGIGIGADQVTSALDHLTIDTTKISLKGLTGDDLTAAINGVISKTMDEMAEAAIPGLDKFRKVGEGYAETVVRIATDYAKIDGILGGIGMTFGAVGLESIAARESLISLAGGIDQLASQTKGFAGNFLSQAEQLAPVQKYVTDQLAAMGMAGIQTREDFKNVVLGLDLTQPAAQATYASLMSLQEAFAKTHAATVDLTKSEQEIADERADLQKQYDQLTMTSTQLRAKERLAITGSNLALFDQITQLQTIKDTSDALKTSIDKLETFKDGILSFRDSLTLGSLSTLNPMQKAAEAQRQYEDMLAKAKAGDETARAGIQGAATAYLTADQIVKASSDGYVNDAMKVQSDLMALADAAGAQISVDQLQLTALDSQVTQMTVLNTKVEGLREDNAKLREDNAKLLTAVQEQTSVLATVIAQSADTSATKINQGAMSAGQMRNYKLNLDAEAVAQ